MEVFIKNLLPDRMNLLDTLVNPPENLEVVYQLIYPKVHEDYTVEYQASDILPVLGYILNPNLNPEKEKETYEACLNSVIYPITTIKTPITDNNQIQFYLYDFRRDPFMEVNVYIRLTNQTNKFILK